MNTNCQLVFTGDDIVLVGADIGNNVLSGYAISESLRRGGNLVEKVSWFGRSEWWSTKTVPHNMFYPVTCSCGDYGCAGIFEPVRCRVRKHTVEWRVPHCRGYDRLSGKFLCFDRNLYELAVSEFLSTPQSCTEDCDDEEYYDYD